MLRHLIRVASAISVLVFAVVATMQASIAQLNFPHGATQATTLFLSSSSLPRDELVAQMRQLGEARGLEIYLVAPDQDDFTHGMSVYSLGASQPERADPMVWLDPSRHGETRPASRLGRASLTGHYALRGSPEAVAEFQRWVEGVGVAADWTDYRSHLIKMAAQGPAALVYVAVLVLLASLVMAWFAARSESRAVRLLAGTPTWRIHAQDLAGLAQAGAAPGLATTLALGGSLALARGGRNALLAGGIFVWYLLAAGVFALVAGVALSAITWPRVEELARRDPPVARFSVVSEVGKALAFCLALASLPTSIALARDATQTMAAQEITVPLRAMSAGKLGGMRMADFENQIGSIGGFIAEADRDGLVAFGALSASPGDDGWAGLGAGDHDAVLLVDQAHLRLNGLHGPGQTAAATDPALRARVAYALGPSLRTPDAQFQLRTLAPGARIGVSATDSQGFAAPHDPMLVVAGRVSDLLSDDALVSAATSNSVLFSDTGAALRLAKAAGDEHAINGFESVTDHAGYIAGAMRLVASMLVAATLVLVAAVAACAVISAHVAATKATRTIFALRTFGRTWWQTLRRRLATQTVVTLAVFGAVAAGHAVGGQPFSPWLLSGLAAYLTGCAALDVAASNAAFDRAVARIH